jgi:hypothetical protein
MATRNSFSSQTVAPIPTSATSKPPNKSIRFLPDSVVSELMSGSAVSVRNTNETKPTEMKPLLPPTPSVLTPSAVGPGAMLPWGGPIKGKLKRSKPRVGGGWGCCLDCAAGENRQLYSWEESETCLLLLRELIGTLPQTTLEGERRIRSFLRSQVKVPSRPVP